MLSFRRRNNFKIMNSYRNNSILVGISIMLLLLASACLFREDPRPDAGLNKSEKLTTSDLNQYINPYCRLNPNTIVCNFLNYNFEITDVTAYSRDSIVAFDRNNPQNRISLRFQNIFDQNGTYKITSSSYITEIKNSEVYITLRGNKFGGKPMFHFLKSGEVSVKQTASGYDLVYCDAYFDYNVNGIKYLGIMSAHFVVNN